MSRNPFKPGENLPAVLTRQQLTIRRDLPVATPPEPADVPATRQRLVPLDHCLSRSHWQLPVPVAQPTDGHPTVPLAPMAMPAPVQDLMLLTLVVAPRPRNNALVGRRHLQPQEAITHTTVANRPFPLMEIEVSFVASRQKAGSALLQAKGAVLAATVFLSPRDHADLEAYVARDVCPALSVITNIELPASAFATINGRPGLILPADGITGRIADLSSACPRGMGGALAITPGG